MEKTALPILKNKQFFQNLMSEDYSQRENTFFGEKKIIYTYTLQQRTHLKIILL